MTMLNVQFADPTNQVIVSYFSSPQDPAVWPNQGTVDTSDARWSAFYSTKWFAIQQMLPAPTT